MNIQLSTKLSKILFIVSTLVLCIFFYLTFFQGTVAKPSGLTEPLSVNTVLNVQASTIRPNVGVVVDDYANKYGGLSSLQQILPNPISTVSIYKQFGSKYNSTLNLEDLSYIKSNNINLLIAWEPWDPDQGLHQSRDYLKLIYQGRLDNYLRDFAASVKSYGAPVTIRFAHEMNGNWYPWGNRAKDYKKSYRYIVNYFKGQGVTNVKWMWSINADNVPYSQISNSAIYYPGDDVVDIIGIDGFNFGRNNWRSFKDIIYPAYSFTTMTYSKPVIISEVASSEIGGDKPLWITTMFIDTLPNYFPNIHEIIWFDLLKETDWRINSTLSSQQAFVDALK